MGLRLTPWRNQQEWLATKRDFYPDNLESHESRDRAVNRVRAWSVRGRVPHSALSTAVLTTALIRDQSGVLTPLEARLLLAMAISRFVNGLLDPAQQAVYAISMVALAKTINLPESFVEIRHGATHDTLPSLAVLRSSLVLALDWLWTNYWNVKVKTTHAGRESKTIDQRVVDRLENLFKNWRKTRKKDPKKLLKTGDPDPSTQQAFTILKEVSRLTYTHQMSTVISTRLMSNRHLLHPVQDFRDFWRPLINALVRKQPELLTQLALTGIGLLGEDVPAAVSIDLSLFATTADHDHLSQVALEPQVKPDTSKLEAIVMWLLTDATLEGLLDVAEVLKVLSMQKDQVTLKLMHRLNGMKGFEDSGRLLGLRLRLTEASKSSPDIPASTGLTRAVDETTVLNTTSSGRFQRIQATRVPPIGFVIT